MTMFLPYVRAFAVSVLLMKVICWIDTPKKGGKP